MVTKSIIIACDSATLNGRPPPTDVNYLTKQALWVYQRTINEAQEAGSTFKERALVFKRKVRARYVLHVAHNKSIITHDGHSGCGYKHICRNGERLFKGRQGVPYSVSPRVSTGTIPSSEPETSEKNAVSPPPDTA